jgi:hypothetical protein
VARWAAEHFAHKYCLRGGFPPVLFRGVSLQRAILRNGTAPRSLWAGARP